MNRCGSFPLLSSPHSFFSIWTNLKRSEKIPGAPMRRWGEWIWLTGPSRLHRNSPQGLNISFIRSEIRKSQSPFAPLTCQIGVIFGSTPMQLRQDFLLLNWNLTRWYHPLQLKAMLDTLITQFYNYKSNVHYFWSVNFFRPTMHSKSPKSSV